VDVFFVVSGYLMTSFLGPAVSAELEAVMAAR
jgi:peptidoglycan/LPS O-acetylase OafA/YrhL